MLDHANNSIARRYGGYNLRSVDHNSSINNSDLRILSVHHSKSLAVLKHLWFQYAECYVILKDINKVSFALGLQQPINSSGRKCFECCVGRCIHSEGASVAECINKFSSLYCRNQGGVVLGTNRNSHNVLLGLVILNCALATTGRGCGWVNLNRSRCVDATSR